jgi:FtsH-binding integral membrane protein
MVSFIAAIVADSNGGAVVVMAALMTLGKGLAMIGLVSVLTIYAYNTKTDFTTPWALMLALITSIVMFLMFFFINWTPAMQKFYCSIGIFVFGLYLIIDTQMVMEIGLLPFRWMTMLWRHCLSTSILFSSSCTF